MEFFNEYRTDLAALLLRVILGILFLGQGYDKIFGMGLKETERGMDEAMSKTHLPTPFINIITIVSSVLEFAGGLLLIVGLWTVPALFILALDLAIVALGMSLRQPLWDMRHFWPRLVMLIILLLLPMEHDRFSIDNFFHLNGIHVIAG
ncbi:MAG TPA: DoxX family protein [Bacteroidia bacterium]|jgi:putative oxidoreductase|nr:DoxX family protein [Bacteroidia bacterium]